MNEKKLLAAFTYHAPTPSKVARHQEIRSNGLMLALLIRRSVPVGRERDLAITRLREAVMWANAGIALEVPAEEPTQAGLGAIDPEVRE